MRKTSPASAIATIMPAIAETQTLFFSTSMTKNSVNTGKAETSVDTGQQCSGS